MKVLFRTDASSEIGYGHTMRCLALAGALTDRGAACAFVARDLPGSLITATRHQGFPVYALPSVNGYSRDSPFALVGGYEADAEETLSAAQDFAPDWIVVDHYGVGESWERIVARRCPLLIMDDLANRRHVGTVLVNQNLGVDAGRYEALVPKGCHVLLGPQYALLRPEFAAARVTCRVRTRLSALLISMGGTDPGGVSAQVLLHLSGHVGHLGVRSISVVLGSGATSLEATRRQASTMPVPTSVEVGVTDMAHRMAVADLAIGAGGTTSWERCCVGLPSIILSLAPNQEGVAAALVNAGAAEHVSCQGSLKWADRMVRCLTRLAQVPDSLTDMSRAAYRLTDGTGAARIADGLMSGCWK